jgi:hypothetical protein
MEEIDLEIRTLKREIELLKQQWPAHSVSPTLLQRLEELEDALAQAQSNLAQKKQAQG